MRIPKGTLILLYLGTFMALVLAGCGSSSETTTQSTTERFKEAMAALEDEDYLEAQELFEVIILQDPASELADDAQFYLAEAFFRNEDYRMAAFNYNRLRQSFPNSPFYKQALFRASECYYHSSSQYERDQSDTEVAIDQYRIFAQLYPNDSLTAKANDRIRQLRSKLAQRQYAIAAQYVNMEEHKAALIYFDRVIAEFPDTDFYSQAILGKVQSLKELERPGEAMEEINRYME